MTILQAKAGEATIITTAKATPSSSVPEQEKDNNVYEVGISARVTRIPSIA